MLIVALAGCTPEPPEPTPTPTSAFASEAEAFAAAEETYRAYVEALNARHADPTARPQPTDFLIGEALEAELDTEQLLKEQGRSIVGPARATDFRAVDAEADLSTVTAVICLDVADSRLLDEEGVDVTPADRPDLLALEVEFVVVDGDLAISRSDVAGDQTCSS